MAHSSWVNVTTASSQVEISHRPVSWRFPRSEYGPTLEFYDDFHQEIILINSEFVYKSHKQSSKLNKFHIKVPNHTSILHAKFSPQNKYIGLQINRHELQIKTIRGEIVVIQQCRNIKQGNEILGFHWINTKDANLCMVSRNGIELYGLQASHKQMLLTKCVKYATCHHWYLPSQQFLMLVNESFVFYGVKLTYLQPEKINKFEIVGIDSHLLSEHNVADFYQQITLIEMQNSAHNIGCIFIDERKTKLYLFKVIRAQMQLTHSYHLYSSGRYTVFHIDSVLVAYNRNTEMPILIDFNGNNYISAPLPITMCYYEGNDPSKPKRIFSTQKHIAAATPSSAAYVKKPPPKTPPPSIQPLAYKPSPTSNFGIASPCSPLQASPPQIADKRYRFISPLFILEQWSERFPIYNSEDAENEEKEKAEEKNNSAAAVNDSGNFYSLSLNLDAIVHSWGPERQIPLLHFLLHRETNDSKTIIVKMLYEMIKAYCLGNKFDLRSRLDFISEYFIVLNEVLRRAVEESAIIAQTHHQQQLLQQQKKQQLLAQNQSFTSRFRRQSQTYAAKLFGAPPSAASASASSSPSALHANVLHNDQLLYRSVSSIGSVNSSGAAASNKLLPPPHLPSRSRSATTVSDSHNVMITEQFLPAPAMHSSSSSSSSHNHHDMQIGRRVAATVKFDLEKTSQGETVIKTTELLEEVFHPIFKVLIAKHERYKSRSRTSKKTSRARYNEEIDANDNADGDDEFKLPDGVEWSAAEISKCLDRFCAVLIEYTRTMHRIRLKLPTSILMLLIRVLRETHKLYTLHQLFQYHAFPDDEKLAMELLAMSSTSYPAGKQLGIDMLLRLGRWSKICRILLEEHEIETGVRLFLEKYPFDKKNNLEQIQLTDFLQAALKLDLIRFYHLYQGLSMIISSHHSIFSYYSDYYAQTLYGGHTAAAADGTNNKKANNQPGQASNAKKYGYNNESLATNLHVLFADEMQNFKHRFDSLKSRFCDDE